MSDFEKMGRNVWRGLLGIALGVVGLATTALVLTRLGAASTVLVWVISIPFGLVAGFAIAIVGSAMVWAAVAPVVRWWKRRNAT